jgi:acetoin utilization protein AcuB
MLLKHWMSKTLIVIDQDEAMNNAVKLMKENGIEHLPVTRKGKLVGIVTKSDLFKASPSEATSLEIHELTYLLAKMKVKDIMTKNPVTVSMRDTVEHAAQIMLENDVTCLPVMDGDHVISIITDGDLFRVLVELTGVRKGGIQFGARIPDEPGTIRPLADVIRNRDGRMVSIVTSYTGEKEGFRQVHMRAQHLTGVDLEALKDELKGMADLLYIFDSDNMELFYEKED